jgi:hypothetical protein
MRFSLLGRLREFLLKRQGDNAKSGFTVAEIAVMILFSDLLSTQICCQLKREKALIIFPTFLAN